ncbi:MAG: ATP-dependent DNA helicase [Gammaproteobacteria bacterium]|nr:ATP-dependent DNA helicase [Gammaproteobacteria bacterium]
MQARELLDEAGAVAAYVEGFRPRAQQQRMAELVELAMSDTDSLVVEAGTGVGKTFAYLVPALLSAKKVVISTGTKHLQDQLYHKDLPVIRKALALPVKTALLKGRANYLCIHRFESLIERGDKVLCTPAFRHVQQWARRTLRGDIAELNEVAEDSPLWSLVTSTVDNCLGAECPSYSACHVLKARRRAQEADVLIINHHLFFADLALKEEGFSELLPSVNAFVLDEAHQLPEIASAFFGTNLSSRQIQDLARDTIAEQLKESPDMGELRRIAENLINRVFDLRIAMGRESQRGAWLPLRKHPRVEKALDEMGWGLDELREALEMVAERGKGLQACARRVVQAINRLELMRSEPEAAVQWYETFRHSFILHNTPLEIAGIFKKHMEDYPCAWVFTSATLSVGGHFRHFTSRLGLGDIRCEALDSPYDYENNAMLYLPKGLPDPRQLSYTPALVETVLPIIQASGGRAFLLFTSHRALRLAAERLEGRLDYPLLVQGTAPRRELLEHFREAGNAVLLGTSSFWEGVDVRGQALSCVIIDKLPFASPGDPVMQARLEAIKSAGGNPFFEFQLPQAVISLKQGVGRLIRDEQDSGVLVICDPRLLTKPYGKVFLNSLPTLPVTHDLRIVESFFTACDQHYEAVSH